MWRGYARGLWMSYKLHRVQSPQAKEGAAELYRNLQEDFARAIEPAPESAEPRWRRGWCRLTRNLWNEALQDFEDAVRQDPALQPKLDH